MTRRKHGIAAIALGSVVALTAAACGGGTSTPQASKTDAASAVKAGGTLYYLTKRAAEHMDPQRTYIGRDLANQSRLVYRTLTQYKSGTKDVSTTILPDLATDIGTASDGGKTWKFTLKDGVKWEDNSDITCEDLKYGISRTFATDVITGGPNYAIQFLDIPKDAKGAPIYKGPYVTDAAGQAAFDKAVTCDGKTITYKMDKPWGDFNLAATMSAFAPYKKSQDKGDKSNYAIFSNGPYKVEGGFWVKDKGATLVRNPAYDPKTDNLRGAFPDKIIFQEGLADEVIAQRLISDQGNDKFAVSDRRIPPAMRPQIISSPTMKGRYENVLSPFMDYLTPNFKRMTDPKVRQALAISTDKAGWVAAGGGTTAGTPSQTIISPAVLGYKAFNAFNAPDAGDAVKSKALLTEAGVKIPYPITMTFSGGTPTSQKSAAALKAGWEKGGFAVTLNELTDTYYDVIQNPANADKYDVTWAGWGADWPSASTVVPPLFDGRVNLSAASNGSDYGYYNSPELNKMIDAAFAETDLAKQAKLWGDMDEFLAKDVAYIPLQNQKFFLAWGSGVKGWVDNPTVSNYPDLGAIGVQ
ncbi:MAG: ABC transporter substrate-binding protein [Phycicoccus sp.]|nr:ABC transporter substrate-binding protein [Phycicoccus sp.]NMM33187.1 ABC transporter substrate-binding protein [Phycicoccus sp.]